MSPRVHTALAGGGEFDHVRAIWRRLGRRMRDAGDDCAIVPFGGASLAISSDLSIEGTHFRAGWLTPFEIGYRAATAALSDLAAVAATPLGVQTSIGASDELHDDVWPDLMRGVADAATAVGAKVWGGDLVQASTMVIDVTVVGRIDGTPLLRRGASAGDDLYITGRLGGPATALRSWEMGCEPESWARRRFAAPAARTVEAQWLLGHGAVAGIDVSDGLLGDAAHLAAAGGLSCTIDLDAVPCGPGVTAPVAAVSGEEYELLVALPSTVSDGLALDFERTFNLPLARIGRFHDGGANPVQLTANGAPVEIPAGFRHY